MKVLVIEDDLELAKLIALGLQTERFNVDIALDGMQGLKMAASGGYDAVVTDLMLPEKNGHQICTQLRNAKFAMPIIALTAVSDLDTKLKLFNSGVDDYITKPFEIKELSARIRSCLRKQKIDFADILKYKDITLDLKKKYVERSGIKIILKEKELKILEYMMINPEQVLSREMILSYVWGPAVERYTNVVDVHIHKLRNKIDNGFGKKLIRTVSGSGYKIAAD
jgi:DNA-binding response OmpR family regulator